MSDELIALQDTATQARAKADELKAALTDASTDEEKAAAEQADQDATTAESAFAEAKAKADAEAGGAQGGDAQPKAGDACTTDQGLNGTLTEQDGALVCVVNVVEGHSDFAKSGARAGDACVCPDGRPGTVAVFADNLAVCLPNQG